jgi:hypothetical protein
MAPCAIQPGRFRCLFGDRWQFAIEIETAVSDPKPASWGSLWLWFNGKIVGNPQAEEQLGVAADWLMYLASAAGQRPGWVFRDLDASGRLQMFEWWFSQSSEKPPYDWWNDPPFDATAYFVSHIQVGPALDDWWVILTESRESDVITWRAPGSTLSRESRLPSGTFVGIVSEFVHWLSDRDPGRSTTAAV